MYHKIDSFIEGKIREPCRRFVIRKLFPWWDHSYLLKMMSIWAEEASKKHKTIGITMSSDSISKELIIFSEVCKRLANSSYEEDAWQTLDGEDLFEIYPIHTVPNILRYVQLKSSMPEWKSKIARKRSNQLHDFYIFYFLKLIKNIERWWD